MHVRPKELVVPERAKRRRTEIPPSFRRECHA